MLLVWLRKYCFRIRCQLAARAFCGAALALSLFAVGTESITPGSFVLANLAILLLSLLWAALQGGLDSCLSHLGKTDASLEEALRTELELWQQSSTSAENRYFRNRHLEALEKELSQTALPSWWSPLFASSLVMQAVLLAIILFPSASGSFQTPQDTVNISHSFRVLYPAYLNQNSQAYLELPKSLDLPQGSRLEIILQDPLPVGDQSRFSNTKENLALQWFEQQNRWVSTLTPNHSGTLRLDWIPQEVNWQVIPDKAPTLEVKWTLPSDFVFDNDRVFIELSAQDDYALGRIILHYQVQERAKQPDPQALKSGSALKSTSAGVYQEVIQSFEGIFPTYKEHYPWDLSLSSIRAGDQVTAWVTASDTDSFRGPKITRSKTFQFQVQSRKLFHAQLLERLYQIDEQLHRLQVNLQLKQLQKSKKQEAQILHALNVFQNDMMRDSLMTEELHTYVKELRLQLNYYQQQRQQLFPPS